MGFSFDGENKRINLTTGTTTISVRDLWSRWVDWVLTDDNSKYLIAMRELGGDDVDQDEGTLVPIYVFLQNGWRIKPQEANHTLKVQDGILLVDGGGIPFVGTNGSYQVNLLIQQPVQAISFSSSGGSGGGGSSAEEVWSYLFGSKTAQQVLEDAAADAKLARQLAANKAYLNPNTGVLTVYDDDNTTVLKEFNITDWSNNPSVSSPLKRTPA